MSGTSVPKKVPASHFRYLMAFAFGGLSAMQPSVQGRVATMYEIMKMSCQSWSSVDVTYVHPPHVRVRRRPMMATNFGSPEPGLAVRRYHRPTSANRGPDVMAMNTMKKDRSGYRSPMVADTEGNHSSG